MICQRLLYIDNIRIESYNIQRIAKRNHFNVALFLSLLLMQLSEKKMLLTTNYSKNDLEEIFLICFGEYIFRKNIVKILITIKTLILYIM